MRVLALALALLPMACDPQPVAAPTRFPTEAQVIAGAAARVDADGDGSISEAEYLRYHDDPATFRSYDADSDGALSVGELRIALQDADPAALIPQRQVPGMGPPPGTGGPPGVQRGPPPQPPPFPGAPGRPAPGSTP